MQSSDSTASRTPSDLSQPRASEGKTGVIPFLPTLIILLAVGGSLLALLFTVFPLFIPAAELLRPFPPDEIAVARESAFRQGRLTNSLAALGLGSLVISSLLPASLLVMGHAPRRATKSVIGYAIVSALLACVGVGLAHLLMESTTQASFGITRTFIAHWLEFTLFGAGVGLAVGAAVGGRSGAVDRAQRGAIAGFLGATTFDLICVLLPRVQVDSLVPGGVLWGNKDLTPLALWVATLLLGLAIALPGRVRNSHPSV